MTKITITYKDALNGFETYTNTKQLKYAAATPSANTKQYKDNAATLSAKYYTNTNIMLQP